jgi:hypothetical protein
VRNIIYIEIYQLPFVANGPLPDARLLIHNTLTTDCAVGNIINIEIYQLPFVANGPSLMPSFLFTTHYYCLWRLRCSEVLSRLRAKLPAWFPARAGHGDSRQDRGVSARRRGLRWGRGCGRAYTLVKYPSRPTESLPLLCSAMRRILRYFFQAHKKIRFRGLFTCQMPMIFDFFAGLAAISSSWVACTMLPSRPAFLALPP